MVKRGPSPLKSVPKCFEGGCSWGGGGYWHFVKTFINHTLGQHQQQYQTKEANQKMNRHSRSMLVDWCYNSYVHSSSQASHAVCAAPQVYFLIHRALHWSGEIAFPVDILWVHSTFCHLLTNTLWKFSLRLLLEAARFSRHCLLFVAGEVCLSHLIAYPFMMPSIFFIFVEASSFFPTFFSLFSLPALIINSSRRCSLDVASEPADNGLFTSWIIFIGDIFSCGGWSVGISDIIIWAEGKISSSSPSNFLSTCL